MWHYHALSGIRNESYLRNDPAEGTGWPWRIIVIMRRYDVGKRTWNLHSYRIGRKSPVLHRPQKKIWKADFPDKSTTGTTSTSVFLRTTFRNSAITPASPLIKKSTTLRSSLWCSHCSLAKRPQFSCPLGTATLSLKLENVVPDCWICFSRTVAKCFILLLLHRWAVLVRTSIFSKNAVSTTDGWLKLNFASCVISKTRALGALVLCFNMVFVYYIYNMVIDTQFHKFHGRPFARVLYVFLMEERKYLHDVTFSSSSTAVKHPVFFCPHLFAFWGTSQADCGVGDIIRKVHHPGIPSLSVYTSTRCILGDAVKVYHRDFCREKCLIWLRECWSSQSGGARIQLHGSGASDFSNSSKTRAKPTTY